MKRNDEVFITIFSFIFPLTLMGWGISSNLKKEAKIVQLEGLLFNLLFILLIFMLKYLSFIPVIGIVFDFFFNLSEWLYLIFVIVIIGIKINNFSRELPFVSFYASKILKD